MKKLQNYLPLLFVALSVLVFCIAKIWTLNFRYSDGNAYFYMAKVLWQGILPYRDYNLADPPFLILLFAPLELLFGKSLILFQTLPILFDSGTAVLLYLILRKLNIRLAFLAPFIYLFSFTVLATSDYVTGGEITVFLITLAIYLDYLKRPLSSTIAWSLAILIKVYAFPPFLAFYLFKLFEKDKKELLKITLTGLLVAFVVLIPFIIASPSHFIYNILLHQLNRPAGINKWAIFSVFGKEEALLLVIAIAGMIWSRKKDLIFQFLLMLGFLLAYQDLYYLYLHTLSPYLVIFAVLFFEKIYSKYGGRLAGVSFAIFALLLALPIYTYATDFEPQNLLLNTPAVSTAVKNLPEKFDLYGTHEVTPLIALMADKNLFGNYIDTNTQNFTALTLDKNYITASAVTKGVYLIAKIFNYPQYGIKDQGFEEYFDKNLFKRYCRLYQSFPSTSNDEYNQLNIYRCKK